MIDYEKLKNSIKRLEEQYQNFLSLDEKINFSMLDKEAVKESVIQRFETCYDTSWKHLKKYLEDAVGLPDVPNGPKPIFRLAGENNMKINVEKWFEYGQARIDTSYDYSGEKANTTISTVKDFLKEVISLYEMISNEKWNP